MINISNSQWIHSPQSRLPMKFNQHPTLIPLQQIPISPRISTNDSIPSSSARTHLMQKQDKPTNCHFKIRPCYSKQSNKTTSIEGKRIGNFLIVSGKTKPQARQEPAALVVNHFSARNSPSKKTDSQVDHAKATLNPREKNAFRHIQILNSVEKIELKFKNSFNSLNSMSYPVEIRYNQLQNKREKRLIVVFSTQLLCFSPRCYFQRARPHSKDKNQGPNGSFSAETINLLKNLSGKQGPKSFFNHCDLFYKVSTQRQLQQLDRYLKDNNLLNYAGIINVKGTYSEASKIYNLKGINQKDKSIIFIEEEQTLRVQIPAVSQTNSLFIVPRHNNFFVVNQLLQSVKAIECQESISSPSKSPLKRYQFEDHLNKENLHPNIRHKLEQKGQSPQKSKISVSKLDSPKKLSTIRKDRRQSNLKLLIPGKFKLTPLNLEDLDAIGKFHYNLQIKQFRRVKKELREDYASRKDYSTEKITISRSKERSISRNKQDPLNANPLSLEGTYKEKLIAYAKILQAEKQARPLQKQQKTIPGLEVKEQQTDLDELTTCLTSKLRSKTSYQIVGELLRNNSHIAKQIGRYRTNFGAYSEVFRNIQAKHRSMHGLTDRWSQDQGFKAPQLEAYYYQ